jgi:hypothetical protein
MKPITATITMAMMLLASLWLIQPGTASAQDGGTSGFHSRGAYINITKDFYRELQNEGKNQDRIYGQGSSDEYLRRIEVSTRFMVETNLRILEQQEKMIRLLEALTRKNGKHP